MVMAQTSASTRLPEPCGAGNQDSESGGARTDENPGTESQAHSGFSLRVTSNKSPAWDEPQQQNGINGCIGVRYDSARQCHSQLEQ